jgi:lysophospholipase L1-like esterase
VGVVVAGAWAGYRWWRVASSPGRYRLWWRRRALRRGELRYVALGDSLAQGIGARDPEHGYVGLLAARLERATGRSVEVLNLSAAGVMIHDLIRDQLPALRAMTPPPALVTVTIGTNDAGRCPPAQLRRLLDELCRQLPPGALVADLPRFHRGRRAVAAAQASAVIREVLAGHPSLVAVPLDEATRGTGRRYRSADLFHPNDRGHRRYADTFWAALTSDDGHERDFLGVRVLGCP